MLRIAVNALPLMAVHTGIARYLKSLHNAIEEVGGRPQYILCGKILNEPPRGTRKGGLLDSVLRLPPSVLYCMRAAQWLVYERFATKVARQGLVDIFHESFYTPANIQRAVPQVFTLHDLSLLKHSGTHSKDRRMFFDKFFESRFVHADGVIVPSNFIKEELCEYLGVPGDNIHAIPEGVDDSFYPRSEAQVLAVRQRQGIPSEYALFVGTLEPRKNLSVALKALAQCKSELPLVIVGWSGWGDVLFQKELSRLGMRGRVFFPGYVSDDDLTAILTGASVFLYPSLYEGFGLPLLEAMACGTPVICSDVASLPEVGGDAVLYASPHDPDEWCNQIETALHDSILRKKLVGAGRQQVEEFTWEKAAARTVEVFKSYTS